MVNYLPSHICFSVTYACTDHVFHIRQVWDSHAFADSLQVRSKKPMMICQYEKLRERGNGRVQIKKGMLQSTLRNDDSVLQNVLKSSLRSSVQFFFTSCATVTLYEPSKPGNSNACMDPKLRAFISTM
jgi:hypothetical protein